MPSENRKAARPGGALGNFRSLKMAKKLTPSELKHLVSQGKDSHFFERSTMAFFGDTMKNYGVRSYLAPVTKSSGVTHICYELYSKHPVKHGIDAPAYFDSVEFNRVIKPNFAA